jgi:hypothetical protein
MSVVISNSHDSFDDIETSQNTRTVLAHSCDRHYHVTSLLLLLCGYMIIVIM